MKEINGRTEIVYQMTMNAARKLLDEGLITKELYCEFETNMMGKYSPIIGGLFSNLNLL